MNRSISARKKQDIVCQAMGYRTALLEILPDIKNTKLRDEIIKRGEWADSQALAHDGFVLIPFRDAIHIRKSGDAWENGYQDKLK